MFSGCTAPQQAWGGHGLAPSKSGYSNHRTLHHIFPLPPPPPQIYSAASNVGVRMKAENGAFINKNYSWKWFWADETGKQKHLSPPPHKLQNRMVITAPGDKVPHKGEPVHNLHFQRIFTEKAARELQDTLACALSGCYANPEVHALEWLLQHLPQDSLQMFIFSTLHFLRRGKGYNRARITQRTSDQRGNTRLSTCRLWTSISCPPPPVWKE